LCRRYLLEGQLAARELTFGEAAHIIGQRATEGSPRGLGSDLEDDQRDDADNLILICDDEHSEIDKIGSRGAFTAAFLQELKRKHEDRVRLATGFGEYQRTTPIRMLGSLRGRPVDVGRDAVATAVMASAGRMPRFDLSTRNAVEIDLRGLPGEEGPKTSYYGAACAAIDRVINHKVAEAISNEDIVHLSVFAFARLPLLVYLGAQLDDTVPVDIYQKHRATEDWRWPHAEVSPRFTVKLPDQAPAHDEAVLIINVSGTIHNDELPSSTSHLARYAIDVDQLPQPDVLASAAALAEFSAAGRRLLAQMEAVGHKHIRLLNVFAAIPLSAAVAFGRIFADEVHPALQLYDRTHDGVYVPAIQVGKR
jgi:SMODS-associated and fused to various effectors sensor domain